MAQNRRKKVTGTRVNFTEPYYSYYNEKKRTKISSEKRSVILHKESRNKYSIWEYSRRDHEYSRLKTVTTKPTNKRDRREPQSFRLDKLKRDIQYNQIKLPYRYSTGTESRSYGEYEKTTVKGRFRAITNKKTGKTRYQYMRTSRSIRMSHQLEALFYFIKINSSKGKYQVGYSPILRVNYNNFELAQGLEDAKASAIKQFCINYKIAINYDDYVITLIDYHVMLHRRKFED